ncbi:hypothetical protein BSG1_06577 [Bacillus sp. SG-1]|nr:hypothetical protein BSG1_06577 [Bacillus sp. SG-1]
MGIYNIIEYEKIAGVLPAIFFMNVLPAFEKLLEEI